MDWMFIFNKKSKIKITKYATHKQTNKQKTHTHTLNTQINKQPRTN